MTRFKIVNIDGELVEEFITATLHFFKDGKKKRSISDLDGGEYTGRFWFIFLDGRQTKKFTAKSAPKWLLALYENIGRSNEK